MLSLLVDKNNAHHVYKCDIENQIYVSFSLIVRQRTFPNNLKTLKTNVICYMAKQE